MGLNSCIAVRVVARGANPAVILPFCAICSCKFYGVTVVSLTLVFHDFVKRFVFYSRPSVSTSHDLSRNLIITSLYSRTLANSPQSVYP